MWSCIHQGGSMARENKAFIRPFDQWTFSLQSSGCQSSPANQSWRLNCYPDTSWWCYRYNPYPEEHLHSNCPEYRYNPWPEDHLHSNLTRWSCSLKPDQDLQAWGRSNYDGSQPGSSNVRAESPEEGHQIAQPTTPTLCTAKKYEVTNQLPKDQYIATLFPLKETKMKTTKIRNLACTTMMFKALVKLEKFFLAVEKRKSFKFLRKKEASSTSSPRNPRPS